MKYENDFIYQAVLTQSWANISKLFKVNHSHHPNSSREKIKNKNTDVVNRLLQYKSEYGETPLHVACMNSYTPFHIIKKIYFGYPQAVIHQDCRGETPFHIAAAFSSDRVIHFLLRQSCQVSHCRIDVASMTNNQGELPLYMALLFSRSISIIHALLEAYPLAVLHINALGITPLQQFAIESESFVRYCLRRSLCLRGILAWPGNDKEKRGIENKHTYSNNKKIKSFLETLILLLHHRRICARVCAYDTSDHDPKCNEKPSFSSSSCKTQEIQSRYDCSHISSFLPLHMAILDPECPWIFVHLMLIAWPKEATRQDRFGNLPIHLIAATIKESVITKSIRTQSSIQTSTYTALQDQLSLFQTLICLHPHIASIPTIRNGKLPLVLYIESTNRKNQREQQTNSIDPNNVSQSQPILQTQTITKDQNRTKSLIIMELLRAQPNSLTTRDMETHLYPFMLAAMDLPTFHTRKEHIMYDDQHVFSSNDKTNHDDDARLVNQFSLGFELLMQDPSVVKHSLFDLWCSSS